MRILPLILLVMTGLLSPQVRAGGDAAQADLRDLRVGMAVDQVDPAHFRNLRCAGPGPHTGERVASVQQFALCDADAQGLVALGLDYANDEALARMNDRFEGTKLGGHPVTLALGIDRAGRIQTLGVSTDPNTSRFLRKKAFLLGMRVKARYGADNWQCTHGAPGGGLQAVGGMFIDETCEKQLADRHLRLQTRLFRRDGPTEPEVVNETRLDIRAVAAPPG